ncbi:hypothetical protein [Rufibacter roseus]|uniref:DUF1735 domain-containing protein n=1 Tax=Rufibacter roseus TaxID=1567108 RepID=A0ABW2DFK3_9BACT|nr:hypothetical protein [Rufibacter roseus]
MKTFTFRCLAFASLVLLGTSCMHQYVPDHSYNRLSAIPTPFHQNEVEVFFPGEKPTDTAYVKIGVLEHKAEGEVAYSTLLENLKAKAQEQGIDAILLLGKNQSTRIKTDETLGEILTEILFNTEIEDNYYSVTTHELAAVGIKYKRNLQYLPGYVQAKSIYALEGGKEELVATVRLNHQGMPANVTPTSSSNEITYNYYVQPYDVDFLLRSEGSEWRYSTKSGQIKTRKQMSGNGTGPALKVKITYNAQNQPTVLELIYPGTTTSKTIQLTYRGNQIAEKLILMEQQLYLKEINQFSTEGKLLSTTHYKMVDGQEQPFLKTVYEYYGTISLQQ